MYECDVSACIHHSTTSNYLHTYTQIVISYCCYKLSEHRCWTFYMIWCVIKHSPFSLLNKHMLSCVSYELDRDNSTRLSIEINRTKSTGNDAVSV